MMKHIALKEQKVYLPVFIWEGGEKIMNTFICALNLLEEILKNIVSGINK